MPGAMVHIRYLLRVSLPTRTQARNSLHSTWAHCLAGTELLWAYCEPLWVHSLESWASLFGGLPLGVQMEFLDCTSSSNCLRDHSYLLFVLLCVLFWGEPLWLVQDWKLLHHSSLLGIETFWAHWEPVWVRSLSGSRPLWKPQSWSGSGNLGLHLI